MTISTAPLLQLSSPAHEERCSDCGARWYLDPSKPRHMCGAPGNPTPWRIGQAVLVPTSTGGRVPGHIRELHIDTYVQSAEVYVPAFKFRTVPVAVASLQLVDGAA